MKKKTLLLLAGAAALLVAGAAFLLTREPVQQPDATETIQQTIPQDLTDDPVQIPLGEGLVIGKMDRYSGVYMEDGSDEVVQDVMMLLLHNTADRDLQLARIRVSYDDFTAEFEVTNLPAGESAVLLERNRRPAGEEQYRLVELNNVVFFPEPMGLLPEQLLIEGQAGLVSVTNVSGADLPGPVAVYYKNAAAELFYGGITYRLTIPQGLAAGETVRLPAGHYDPERCRFVMAQCGG